MSNENPMPRSVRISEVADSVLEHLRLKGYEDPELIRLSLGLCLSSLHSATILTARTKESQKQAVDTCLDTFERLGNSFKKSIEDAGIGHVELESGVQQLTGAPPKVTLQ